MSIPLYRKITQGFVEQVFDQFGNCLSQEFVPMEGSGVDRRYIAAEGVVSTDKQLEDDELIEHPEDVRDIESVEKHWPFDMVQPKLVKPRLPVPIA